MSRVIGNRVTALEHLPLSRREDDPHVPSSAASWNSWSDVENYSSDEDAMMWPSGSTSPSFELESAQASSTSSLSSMQRSIAEIHQNTALAGHEHVQLQSGLAGTSSYQGAIGILGRGLETDASVHAFQSDKMHDSSDSQTGRSEYTTTVVPQVSLATTLAGNASPKSKASSSECSTPQFDPTDTSDSFSLASDVNSVLSSLWDHAMSAIFTIDEPQTSSSQNDIDDSQALSYASQVDEYQSNMFERMAHHQKDDMESLGSRLGLGNHSSPVF